MAKVHLVHDAVTYAVRMELDGATPIVPLNAVVLQFPKPQGAYDWEIPPASLSLAVAPYIARGLAQALLDAADELDPQ